MDCRKTFNQFSTFDSHRDHPQGVHSCAPQKERGSFPQARGSGPLFARDENPKKRDNSNADICRKAVDYEFFKTGGNSAEPYCWTAKTANIGTAIRQIPYSTVSSMLEDKTQESSDSLFCFFIGHYVMDQRSGDGRFIGRIKILTITCWKAFSKF